MGQHLATLLSAAALSGCSLIYNPNNLPDKGSMSPDAAIADANPALLRLDDVKSSPLLEGAGQDGSAPQILVIYGEHITKSATLTIVPTQNPMGQVVVDVSDVSIADDGNSIAALVRAGYMESVDESGPNAFGVIALTVTVAQDGATAQSKTWDLKPLDELGPGLDQDAPMPGKRFSHVDAGAAITFKTGDVRAVVNAVGGIKVTRVAANAVARAGGAGGCDGGTSNAAGECFGGGKNGGGGGGFAAPGENGGAGSAGPMSGDPYIKSYDGMDAEMNRGGGGGGGDGAVGGGGGGTIELTAGGNLSVTMLEVKGADGAGSAVRGAGGGSGGAIVLRAGGMLTPPTMVELGGGEGGPGLVIGALPGGKGSVGRWRFDAVTVSAMPAGSPAPRRGPMLVREQNPIFEMTKPTLTITGSAGDTVKVIVTSSDGLSEEKLITLNSAMQVFVPPPLAIGLNTVCVLVPEGRPDNDEAKNCIEVAFIP